MFVQWGCVRFSFKINSQKGRRVAPRRHAVDRAVNTTSHECIGLPLVRAFVCVSSWGVVDVCQSRVGIYLKLSFNANVMSICIRTGTRRGGGYVCRSRSRSRSYFCMHSRGYTHRAVGSWVFEGAVPFRMDSVYIH